MSVGMAIQFSMYFIIVYILFALKPGKESKNRVNRHLLLVFLVMGAIPLIEMETAKVPYFLIILLVIGYLIHFYLKQVATDKLQLNTPLGYLVFYFASLFFILLYGGSSTAVFPEIFIVAVLFASANTGRKVSLGVAFLSVFTISLLFLDQPIPSKLHQVMLTSVVLLGMVFIIGMTYKRSLVQAKRNKEIVDGE